MRENTLFVLQIFDLHGDHVHATIGMSKIDVKS